MSALKQEIIAFLDEVGAEAEVAGLAAGQAVAWGSQGVADGKWHAAIMIGVRAGSARKARRDGVATVEVWVTDSAVRLLVASESKFAFEVQQAIGEAPDEDLSDAWECVKRTRTAKEIAALVASVLV